MDGGEIFIGIAVIVIAAIVTIAANWKEEMGKEIARRSKSQSYINLYEEARRTRARTPVQRSAPGEGRRQGAWSPAYGNPVGYYGRMLWMQLFRRNTWKV